MFEESVPVRVLRVMPLFELGIVPLFEVDPLFVMDPLFDIDPLLVTVPVSEVVPLRLYESVLPGAVVVVLFIGDDEFELSMLSGVVVVAPEVEGRCVGAVLWALAKPKVATRAAALATEVRVRGKFM